MRRCNRAAKHYARTNGYRLCDACLDAASESVVVVMHYAGSVIGDCDRPIETREEFYSRMGRQDHLRPWDSSPSAIDR